MAPPSPLPQYQASPSTPLSAGASPSIPKFVKPQAMKERSISNITCHSTNVLKQENITFGPQKSLPPLPIPSLEETMDKFLRHLEALEVDGDPEDRRMTEQVVREFLLDMRQEDNSAEIVSGPVLQELLVNYDRDGRAKGTIGSYVEEFWSDAYLAPDSSVVLNLNPYFLLEESPDPKLVGNQIRRAASLCFASIKMVSQVKNETLKPDTFRGKALCMDQFRAIFGAARVPKSKSRDTISINEKSNHVAVLCNNQFFFFQALWPDNWDVGVNEEDIVCILEAIQAHATKIDSTQDENQQKYLNSVSALGVLTSLERNEWAKAREEMIKNSPKNAESFQLIDSALFVLVLDDYVPKNKHDAAANMLHGSYQLAEWKEKAGTCGMAHLEYQAGTCTNRWYDKLQIIVTADGGAGINFEHSAIDGHTALRFVSDIYADTVISFAQSITKLVHAHKGLIPSVITATVRRAADALDNQGRTLLDVGPKKMSFDISESIKRKIYFAETALGDQILASDTHILEFNDYGKHFITFNKLSPDSYVQMAMMIAYYRLYGKIVCAYEPVLTKGFYHGRTEAMRPATMEAKTLCEAFRSPTSCDREKLNALRNATIAHSKLVKECAQGKGVDRHLFALKCIAEKNGLPVPDFFRSEAWRKLNHTVLSTSNCGNPSLAMFGFGPVVPDGYGIGYIIKDAHLHFAICSKHRQTTRYALTLEGVLREMASILKPISNTEVHDTYRRDSKLVSTLTSRHDSYGDIWGENSFQEKLPEVIPESTLEQRWSGEIEQTLDTFLSQPFKAPLNDESTDAVATLTAIDGEMRKIESKRRQRRGSNDIMPIRPDRRSSVQTISVGKSELAELMKMGSYEEEKANGNNAIEEDEPEPNSLPIVAPLNDEVDNDAAVTPKLVRRDSNDLMPIRPSRRTSATTIGSEHNH